MKVLDQEEREAVVVMIAKSESENLLLTTPLVDYLAVPKEQQEIIEIIANSIIAVCNTYHEKIEPDVITSGIALALFSTAASLYDDNPLGKDLH